MARQFWFWVILWHKKHGFTTNHRKPSSRRNIEFPHLDRRRRRTWLVCPHQLASNGRKSQWRILCQPIRLVQRFLEEKTTLLSKNKVLYHQDNARVHKCVVAMAKLNDLNNKLIPYWRSSPNLAPSDYFVFPILKNGSSERDLASTMQSSSKKRSF